MLDVERQRRARVGVTAVPGDELGGRTAAGQFFARYVEAAIGGGAGRVEDGVVARR